VPRFVHPVATCRTRPTGDCRSGERGPRRDLVGVRRALLSTVGGSTTSAATSPVSMSMAFNSNAYPKAPRYACKDSNCGFAVGCSNRLTACCCNPARRAAAVWLRPRRSRARKSKIAMSIAASAAVRSCRSRSSNVAIYASRSSCAIDSRCSLEAFAGKESSFLGMSSLPVCLVTFGPGDFLRIELLGFLDVAIRANNLPVRSEEEEHSGYIRAAHPQLHE
jgi:hypothetical protein